LGARDADVHAVYGRCSYSSSLSYSAGPVSSSFSAEPLALVHGLEWCLSRLKSCHFQLALLLTGSQSARTLLSTVPAFLQPKSFWDIWDLSDSLSSRVAPSFQRAPGHAGLPGNEGADSLINTGATLPVAHVPCPTGSDYCNDWTHLLLFVETNSFSQLTLLPDFFDFLGGSHGHSLLLSSYLCRIKRKENSSCSACGHPLQDLTHLLLAVPHPSLSGAPSMALLPFLTSGSDLGAWPDCCVSVEFLHAPIPREGRVEQPPGNDLLSSQRLKWSELISPYRTVCEFGGRSCRKAPKYPFDHF